jgi:hypothetical protein
LRSFLSARDLGLLGAARNFLLTLVRHFGWVSLLLQCL